MSPTRPIEEVLSKVYGDPERMARIGTMVEALRDAMALAEVREDTGRTQADIGEALGVSQANVSRIERQEDLYLSTLREYVEALGGRLEIRAVFPDRVVTLDPRKRPPERDGKGRAAR